MIMFPREEREKSVKNQRPQFGREPAIPSEAKINCRTDRVLTVQWLVPDNYKPVVTASGAKFFSPYQTVRR